MHEELEEKLTAIECISSATEELKLSLLSFLLTFNVFENEFFKEPRRNEKTKPAVWQRCQAIQEYMNKKKSDLSDVVNNFKDFFKERYITENSTKWKEDGYSLLKTKNNPDGYNDDLFERLRRFLTVDSGVTKKKAIETCLSLSYVFRNNLFHGGKDIKKLENYRECFDVISHFLTELMRELNRLGYTKAWFPETNCYKTYKSTDQ